MATSERRDAVRGAGDLTWLGRRGTRELLGKGLWLKSRNRRQPDYNGSLRHGTAARWLLPGMGML
jgi:hypothetical protein